jgi:hypothetical protein
MAALQASGFGSGLAAFPNSLIRFIFDPQNPSAPVRGERFSFKESPLAGRPRSNPKKKPDLPSDEEDVSGFDPVTADSAEENDGAEGQETASGTSMQEAKGRWLALKRMGMKELVNRALELGITEPRVLRKQALMFAILEREHGGAEASIYAEGVLESSRSLI